LKKKEKENSPLESNLLNLVVAVRCASGFDEKTPSTISGS